jgi:hypothetical protein
VKKIELISFATADELAVLLPTRGCLFGRDGVSPSLTEQ